MLLKVINSLHVNLWTHWPGGVLYCQSLGTISSLFYSATIQNAATLAYFARINEKTILVSRANVLKCSDLFGKWNTFGKKRKLFCWTERSRHFSPKRGQYKMEVWCFGSHFSLGNVDNSEGFWQLYTLGFLLHFPQPVCLVLILLNFIKHNGKEYGKWVFRLVHFWELLTYSPQLT